jgi:N,N'-diacetyllegionaminate synthase
MPQQSKSRAEIIVELATSHGGDVSLACEMIHAAAEAGADTVKLQSYTLSRLNPRDSQAAWLTQAHLNKEAHAVLMGAAEDAKVGFLSTPCDPEALQMLRDLGLTRFKIASSEAHNEWWWGPHEVLVSWPWGQKGATSRVAQTGTSILTTINTTVMVHLTAIPLYPTPLEAVGRAPLLDGWSDHCEGLSACYRALALGVSVIEVHMALPGKSRHLPFDKTPDQIRQLRQFAEDCATMSTGVAERFRTRWSA